ncbi:phosphatase PAP2 family protein [uncultured Microscilla sp.]|uniref:phosphatase PAP2 family protein n=1 Tax=uncultured Microscilla sp. TaxID=432653 RepID=UPI0026075255|nr:phosphatase PAP2 family protein [uncultured Microscilla sp.]
MRQIIRQNSIFFILLTFYLVVGGILLLNHQKGELELWLNQRHTPLGDVFFKYVTFLGDGTFCLIMGGILLFVRFYYALLALLPLLSGLVAQLFKRTIYANAGRPKSFFGNDPSLNFVSGYEFEHLSCCNSFPSGHTTTAFAVFLAFAFIVRSSYLKALFFCLAVCAAISRVYLLQHFFVDTYFGAILGTTTMCLFLWWLEHKKVGESALMQKRLG